MKKLYFFACLFMAALSVSCSSDDSGDNSGGGNFEASFEYVIGGTVIDIAGAQGVKSENSMQIVASDAQGNYIDFEFDKFGNLKQVTTSSTSSETDMKSHRFYVNNYFDFEITEIDEANKTVKATFSGKVYSDDENLNSNSTEISGSFWVKYLDVEPFYPGLDVSAAINGNEWHSTYSYTTNGQVGFSTFILHEISADQYKIMLGFDEENMNPGTHTFTPSTETIYAAVAKYNVATKTYDVFNCTGTISISSNEPVDFLGNVVTGTYSFTAVNPTDASETIQVANGKFKTFYSW